MWREKPDWRKKKCTLALSSDSLWRRTPTCLQLTLDASSRVGPFSRENVKNQNWENAVFADLGSSPSSMEAGRLVDKFGLRPNYETQQPDAAQAYLRAKLRGKPMWIRDQWHEAWHNMKKLVCRLSVALYGHPDSGTDWEHHCDESLKKSGFI